MTENELSNIVIGLSIDIHKALGPGLLENAYKSVYIIKSGSRGFLLKKRSQYLWYLKK